MTEIAPPRVAASEAKDDGLVQLEHAETDQPPLAKGPTDYSGARAKSDPVEIALVRKLDRRILPMLWGMYFLNYVSFCLLFWRKKENEEIEISSSLLF